jgi:hypothetical protein
MISLYDDKTSKASAPAPAKIKLYPASKTSAPTKAAAPIRLYSDTPKKPAAPAKSPSSFNLGDGYGKSTVNDKYSGKPLMTFEDNAHMSSDLLTNRVAPDFDPTKPQKIDPNVLHNDRMPAAASDAVRKATGAAPNTQLDHLISLEVGGSNDSSNLNPEDLKPNGTQYSLSDEDKIAKLVANGDKTGVSYIDGQKMIARLKGVQLPDDPDFPSSTHPLARYYPNPAPNQTGTKAQTPKPTSLLENLKANLVDKITSGKDPINAIGAAVYKSIDDHLESSSPVQLASQIQTQGLTKTLQGIWSDIKTGLSNLNKPTLGASFAHNLSADDMNAVIDRRAELVAKGVDPHKATVQAASEIISKKVQDQLSNAVQGSLGDGGEPLEPKPIANDTEKAANTASDLIGKKLYFGGEPYDPAKFDAKIGISITPSYKAAEPFAYAGEGVPRSQNIHEIQLDPKAKILPFNQIPKDLYHYSDFLRSFIPGPAGSKFADDATGNFEGIIDYARKNGYDAVDLRNFGSKDFQEAEIRVINPDVIKTEAAASTPAKPIKNFTGESNRGLTPEQSQSIATSAEKGTAEATIKTEAEQEAIKAHNEMAEKSAAAPPVPNDSFFQKLKNTINPLKQQDPQTQKIFQDYTKKLAASRQLGNDEAKTLSDIPVQEGWDAILREERGSASPYTDKIKGKFQDLLSEGRSRGLNTSERKNYVPHAYAETPEDIKQVTRNYLTKKGVPAAEIDDFMNETHPIPDSTAKRLGLNPFFTKTRIFPTYDDAIAAGLHPKYTHPAQLAGFYRETMERNIANRELVKDLVTNGKLFTGDLAPKGYHPVNLEFSSKAYYAKPRLAQMLNGLFHDGNSTTFMDRVAGITGKISSTVQKMELTTGVPKMNVNLHSLGQLIKEITAGDVGKIGTFIRSQSDRASVKFFEDNAGVLKRMASNNIDVGRTVGDYENLYPNLLKPGVKDAYARGGAKSVAAFLTKESGVGFEKVFSKKNFSSFMPQLLVQTFKDASDHFAAQGMDRPAADALGADVTRAYHGLIGNVGRSEGTKDGLSAAFYAPPFRESIINTLWNSVKSVTTEIGNPAYYKNRNLLAGMGLTYGLYAAANKYFTGHYIWQNPSTHQFDLQIPTGNGNYAYVPFMPSFLAVPRDVLGGTLSTAEGDLKGATQQFTGVLSAPVQLFGQLYANKDFYGRPIYADTDSGAVKAQKIASYLGLNTVPPFVKEAVNYIENKGTTPLWQSITAGLALPIKYGSDAKNNTSDFYNALDNYNTQHTQALATFKPTFDKIQQLLQSGQKDEALKEVNALSDSDYELYKDLKAGTSRSSTTKAEAQFLPIFRSVQSLLKEGKTDQANQIVNGLSDPDWKLYQSLKKKNIQ